MKSLVRALVGAVIAGCAGLASAQATTVTFESATSNITHGFATQGVAFYSKEHGAYWGSPEASVAPYDTGPGQNVTGYAHHPVPNALHGSWAFSSQNGQPFTFQGFDGCCAPIFLQLSPSDGSGALFVGWNGTSIATGMGNGLLGPTQRGTYVESIFNNVPLNEVAFWSFDNNFAVDNIKVTLVPEPGAYAMMLAGLGVMTLVAHRRKRDTQA